MIFGAINNNTYFSPRNTDNYYTTRFKVGSGYMFGCAMDSIWQRWPSLRCDLHLDHYSGDLMMSYQALGGGATVEGSFKKTALTFCISPLNFNIAKIMYLHTGIEYSQQLAEEYSGYSSGWRYQGGSYKYELHEKGSISLRSVLGLRVITEFRIQLTHSINLRPTIHYYRGLTSDFNEFIAPAKSQRIYLGIGIGKSY